MQSIEDMRARRDALRKAWHNYGQRGSDELRRGDQNMARRYFRARYWLHRELYTYSTAIVKAALAEGNTARARTIAEAQSSRLASEARRNERDENSAARIHGEM